MIFEKQEENELPRAWKLLRNRSKVFVEESQFAEFLRRSGNHIYVSDSGAVAVLGRWRPHLSCLVIWEIVPAHAARAPVIRSLVESAEKEGFEQIASPLVNETGARPYRESGFQSFQTITKMQKRGFDYPRVLKTVRIVPAEESLLEPLVDLERRAFSPFWWLDKDSFREFLRDHHFVVALLKNGVVGYNISNILGEQGTIYRLGVHPGYRGQGIGSQLLAEAIGWFARHRVKSIALTTQKENQEGQRLYRKFGFEPLADDLHILVCEYDRSGVT
jgi:ribosomal-protein-alanine N-acetyltransferase